MIKNDKILWIDLEMTGLIPDEDKIIEVAAIITDWNLNEISTYESAVKVNDDFIKARFKQGSEFWDQHPEARDGLIKQNLSATKDYMKVEDEILEFCKSNFENLEKIILAGNSIHQDRKFIGAEWPNLNKILHYRMLDVSAWKVVFEHKYNKKFSKPEEHRALEDIRGSIMELKYYLKKIKINE